MQSPLSLPKIAVLSAAIAVIAITAPTAQAVEIKAQVDWALAGTPGAASPDVDGPASSGYVDVLNSDSDGSGNSIFYHTYGDVTGNFGSRVSGDSNFDINGEFTFKENYIATSTMPTFTFTVIPGEIRANQFYTSSSLPVPAGLDMFARYEIDIRVNGSSVWDSSAQVQVTNAGGTFSDTGTNSIGGTPSFGADFASYEWLAPFTDTIGLGTFTPGDTFLLEYDLITLARGNADGTGCMGGGGPDGEPNRPMALAADNGNGTMGPCGTAISRSGDPFSVSPNPPGSSGSVAGAVAAVPEPATLAIFAAGIAGIGAVRRSKRR